MFKLLINGISENSEDGRTTEIKNPARNSELVGEIAYGGVEDAKKAIDAAYKALPSWSETPPRSRSGVLLRAADLVESSEKLIAETLTREQGKPLQESLGETRLTVSVLRYYAGLAPAISGR
ncbi:MAG TPA: aldehyde dehydrogenase family protein, partial [Nitrososphaerales archaeon]|nr:aldehyde dehydrogenase family protein [Nitrososphaerales archaeon]